MSLIKSLCFFLLSFVVFGCSSRFPVDKRFWTPEDYRNVIFEIQYETPRGEEFPRFSNPETAEVIRKLVDPQNYEVVLDDPELGLNYKNEVAQAFFDRWQDLNDAYDKMDVQDKFMYPEEMIEIGKFGLALQIKYFALGNEQIIARSDSPGSDRTKGVLRSNERTVIGNFNLYLDMIKNEGYFGNSAHLLADGITTHFFKLIETFPDADYSGMLNKTKSVLEKTKVPEIKTALTSLVSKLESMKKPV